MDTNFPDYHKWNNQKYALTYENRDDDRIGMCVYGDSNPPTLVSFDGQFEGLAPRPEERNLRSYDVQNTELFCNYEARFDDIDGHEA